MDKEVWNISQPLKGTDEVDELRVYYTEWSQSEREKQILYINTYIWNLERWYWWTSLQDSKEDADKEYRLADTLGEREGGTNWKSSIETYALPYVKWDSLWKFAVWCRELKFGALRKPRGVGWGGGGRLEGSSRGRGHMYITTAHSCWCMAETNTIL